MSSGTYAPDPFEQYCDDNGNPLSSGTLTTYAAGTSTPVTTYADVNLTIANTNPISLDAAGRPTSGAIFLTPGVSYKFVLMDSLGATVATRDNIAAVPLSPNVTGTWIPVIGGITSTSGQTYSGQFGAYTKFGHMVVLQYSVQLSAKGTIVGSLQLQGFPFVNNFGASSTVGLWTNANGTFVELSLFSTFGTSAATISGMVPTGDVTNFTPLIESQITDTFLINGTLIYTTNS